MKRQGYDIQEIDKAVAEAGLINKDEEENFNAPSPPPVY